MSLPAPRTVLGVDLDVKRQQVTVQAHAGAGPFPCPECQVEAPGYDRKPRRWRHLDTCQFTTWIEAEIPGRGMKVSRDSGTGSLLVIGCPVRLTVALPLHR